MDRAILIRGIYIIIWVNILIPHKKLFYGRPWSIRWTRLRRFNKIRHLGLGHSREAGDAVCADWFGVLCPPYPLQESCELSTHSLLSHLLQNCIETSTFCTSYLSSFPLPGDTELIRHVNPSISLYIWQVIPKTGCHSVTYSLLPWETKSSQHNSKW